MIRRFAISLALSILFAAPASVGYSQTFLSRTWVSGGGNDANDCSRTAPCQTFDGALSKTVVGGEINCLDPGGFGPTTITKSITIDCNGIFGGVIATFQQVAIYVNCGAGCVVILRNLELDGGGQGDYGIRFKSGDRLVIDNVRVLRFHFGGVLVDEMTLGETGNVVISNSTISSNENGIVTRTGTTVVSRSVITGTNNVALSAQGNAAIDADGNVLAFNGVAVKAGSGGTGQEAATVRISNNDIYSNRTGLGCGGGVLASDGTNRKAGNTGGTVPTCAPTATITHQ